MCLAIPGQIIRLAGDGEAVCDIGGIEKTVNVSLIERPVPGDWVIVHVGFAITRLDEEAALETLRLFQQAGLLDEEFGAIDAAAPGMGELG